MGEKKCGNILVIMSHGNQRTGLLCKTVSNKFQISVEVILWATSPLVKFWRCGMQSFAVVTSCTMLKRKTTKSKILIMMVKGEMEKLEFHKIKVMWHDICWKDGYVSDARFCTFYCVYLVW